LFCLKRRGKRREKSVPPITREVNGKAGEKREKC